MSDVGEPTTEVIDLTKTPRAPAPQQPPVIGPVKMPAIAPAGTGTSLPKSSDPANPNVWKG